MFVGAAATAANFVFSHPAHFPLFIGHALSLFFIPLAFFQAQLYMGATFWRKSQWVENKIATFEGLAGRDLADGLISRYVGYILKIGRLGPLVWP